MGAAPTNTQEMGCFATAAAAAVDSQEVVGWSMDGLLLHLGKLSGRDTAVLTKDSFGVRA